MVLSILRATRSIATWCLSRSVRNLRQSMAWASVLSVLKVLLSSNTLGDRVTVCVNLVCRVTLFESLPGKVLVVL